METSLKSRFNILNFFSLVIFCSIISHTHTHAEICMCVKCAAVMSVFFFICMFCEVREVKLNQMHLLVSFFLTVCRLKPHPLVFETLQVRDEELGSRQAWVKPGYVALTQDFAGLFCLLILLCRPAGASPACMESTACQTCGKRSPSHWSATWSVPSHRFTAQTCKHACVFSTVRPAPGVSGAPLALS